jgi:hypothetical protein
MISSGGRVFGLKQQYSYQIQSNVPFSGVANETEVVNVKGSGVLNAIYTLGRLLTGATYFGYQIYITVIIDGTEFTLWSNRESGPGSSTQIRTNGWATYGWMDIVAFPSAPANTWASWEGAPQLRVQESPFYSNTVGAQLNIPFKKSLVVKHHIYPGTNAEGAGNSSAEQKIWVAYSV